MNLAHILSYGRVTVTVVAVAFMISELPLSASGANREKITARYVKVEGLPQGQVLWVRSGPGTHFRRIGLLRHNARHVRNHGCKQVPRGYWCEISYRGLRGWSSGRYLANDRSRRV
jgi:uncharacterized protein YraI